MGKLAILKLGEGDFEQGFSVTLRMGEDGLYLPTELEGKLPKAPILLEQFQEWRNTHRSRTKGRMEPIPSVTNISDNLEQALTTSLNSWLNSDLFRPIRERLLQKLKPDDEVRVIIQTEDAQLRRLPWHLWEFFEHYPQAEVALSAPDFDQVPKSASRKNKVRILAILGDSTGIDVKADRHFLENLSDAETVFLVEPQRQELDEQLWDKRGWDIFFFAGHSSSTENAETGKIKLNPTKSLTIHDLKHSMRNAIKRGLQLAIFNSCDGLGIAQDLASLQIPQIIVMREPVPDPVAQAFLKHFLTAYSGGKSLYGSVREAREKLYGLEDNFPYASWLPVICQNLAETPLSWQELYANQPDPSLQSSSSVKSDRILQGITFEKAIENPNALVGHKLQHYVLQEFIGAGGSGMVYRAWNSTLGQTVCVKVFYPLKSDFAGIATTIARGVRGLAGLNHPNIVKLFDFGRLELEDQASFYIAMEFVQGKTLDCWSQELLENNDLLSKRLQIAFEITMALKDAHNCKYIDEVGFEQTGVLHGDIKPANIVVRPDNSPVLIDFMMVDVQRLLDPKVVPPHLLKQSAPLTAACGTPGFMAPEQQRQGVVTMKTDVYSLGVTFCYLFFPNCIDPTQKLWEQEGNNRLHGLQTLIVEMLNPNPDDRPRDMTVVADRLLSVSSLMGIRLPETVPSRTAKFQSPLGNQVEYLHSESNLWRTIKNNPTAMGLIILGFVISIAAGALFLGSKQPLPSNKQSNFSPATTEQNVNNWLIYNRNGIKIKYPENWELQNIEDKVTGEVARILPSSESNLSKEQLVISIEDLQARPLTLDEYTKSVVYEIKQYTRNNKIIELRSTTLADRPGYLVIYTGTDGTYKFKKMEIWTLKNNKAYIITYTAEESNYSNSKLLKTAQEIMKSFEIIN